MIFERLNRPVERHKLAKNSGRPTLWDCEEQLRIQGDFWASRRTANQEAIQIAGYDIADMIATDLSNQHTALMLLKQSMSRKQQGEARGKRTMAENLRTDILGTLAFSRFSQLLFPEDADRFLEDGFGEEEAWGNVLSEGLYFDDAQRTVDRRVHLRGDFFESMLEFADPTLEAESWPPADLSASVWYRGEDEAGVLYLERKWIADPSPQYIADLREKNLPAVEASLVDLETVFPHLAYAAGPRK